MNITSIFIALLAVGTVLFISSLFLSWRLGKTEFLKLTSDTTLKASLAAIGAALALIAFFSQKELDDVDKKLTDVGNALVEIDIFISKHISAVDGARLDNDLEGGFDKLVKSCEVYDSFCKKHEQPSESLIDNAALTRLSDYLASPYNAEFDVNPIKLIEQSDNIKRVLDPNLIYRVSKEHLWISTSQKGVVDLLSQSRKEAEELQSKFDEVRNKMQNHPTGNTSLKEADVHSKAAYRFCCAIIDLDEYSTDIKCCGRWQTSNMCDIRSKLVGLSGNITKDIPFGVIASRRLSDLNQRIERISMSSDICKDGISDHTSSGSKGIPGECPMREMSPKASCVSPE